MSFFKKNFQYVLAAFLLVLYMALCFVIPSQHDYGAYSRIWDQYLKTGHPYVDETGYFNGNSYGPLFIFLAYLYKLYPLLPRLLFVLMWFGAGLLILKENKKKENNWIIWLGYFLNPYFFIIFLVYGMNEAVNLFFLCSSLYFLYKKKQMSSGFLLAASILFKFIPVFLVPFLFVGKENLNWRFLWVCCASLLVGYGLSYVLWGKEIFEPFLFVTGRGSTYMSLFYILDKFIYTENLSRNLTLLALAVLFAVHIKIRMHMFAIAIIVLLTVLNLYKVSLPWYQSLVIGVIFLSLSVNKVVFSKAMFFYLVWSAAVMVLYIFFNQFYGPMLWMRNFISIPTVLASAGMLYTTFKKEHY